MPTPALPIQPPSRAALLDTLRREARWDVIVIGGGATGLGTAVDAASRGYRTLLLEAADFAKGTSSKATKLVHGGVRYLAQGNISLVREALHERGLLARNAPHLVWPLGFVVPAYQMFDQPFYGIGLKVYDMLAGSLNLSGSRWLNHRETLEAAPTLAEHVGGRPLRGGNLYFDGQFDDARLAVALMRTLFDVGGTAVNYMRVTGLSQKNGVITGVTAQDALDGNGNGNGEGSETFPLRADCVINATGVWVDAVRQMEDGQARTMVAPSQGVHLTIPRSFLPGDRAILIPKTDDGRVLFVVPWNGHTIVGTTDTPRHDLPLEPRAGADDVDFILETAARYLSRDPTRADVTSVWAGLRPLVKATGEASTASLSREHTILVSKAGLITVTGGKWTTYRKMAEDVVETAIQRQLLPAAPGRTADLPLHGATGLPADLPAPGSGSPDRYYGADLPLVHALPGADVLVVPETGLTEAHVRFAARHELARRVEDVLARRNRALFLDARAALAGAPRVAAILAEELGHDAAWQARELESFGALAKGYLL
ncbi:glycerol-3-phosphate dehydrogenase [Cupriavidus sp. OV038]|jgi:glycerol-3-phosphate dehydrogenase|uniref:glycerol-3-phosphate dehydrogenase/oxidase n=2 Tax=Pseudomonadota TaxID=1224 RepID=UPI0008E9170F|nr:MULTISPECIES: glycerol-3-phosphate dehydrogenase/oxidase [unclassified Cupriavidus]SFB72508.1 glycerol-3-phosphate dehydrogenase [Cupriavidus sp. OV038]SFO61308.1 glycerol-3-phosphate dehydrogenase [Cupriavidus sp. OV096]